MTHQSYNSKQEKFLLTVTPYISLLELPQQNTTDWVAYITEIDFSWFSGPEVQDQGASRFGFQWKPLSLVCKWPSSLCAHTPWCLFVYPNLFFHTVISQTVLRPNLTTSFEFNQLFKGQCLISISSHILRYQGLGLQHKNQGSIIQSTISPEIYTISKFKSKKIRTT